MATSPLAPIPRPIPRAPRAAGLAAALIRAGALALLAAPPGAAAPNDIEVKGLFKDAAILVIDGRQRLLRAGQESPEGVRLVSADSTGAVIEVAGEQRPLALGRSISGAFAPPARRTVRLWPTPNAMYIASGSINGRAMEFVVDTGATLVSINAGQARRLGIDFRVTGEPAVSQTAAGPARVYLVRFDRVRLGDIELRNVGGAVHDGDFPEVALLGMSFLGQLDLRREGLMLELGTR
jgi:aspartyl protease family protein